MCIQVVQNLCVIACSVPYLKPFYKGLQSGMIRSDDLRRGHVAGTVQAGNRSIFVEASRDAKGSR
jgi:hypothetical protein